MQQKSPIETRVLLALLLTVLTWGSAFAAIKKSLEAYGPGELALLRLIFGSASLTVYGLCCRMRLPAMRDLPGIFLLGFVGFGFYYSALNFGEVKVMSGVASLLIATTPIFAALLAMFILREKMGAVGWTGVVIAFTGVALIVAGQQHSLKIGSGAIDILVAAISAAFYFVLQRSFLKRYSALELTTYSMWAGTLMTLIFLPKLIHECRTASWQMTATVAYLGVFPAALGYVLWNYALARLPVSRVSSFLYLVPVVGLTIGSIWLHEVPARLSLFGAPIAVLGVYLVNARKRAPLQVPAVVEEIV
jgi:drug/metabolite transporter (DMT)-like permease